MSSVGRRKLRGKIRIETKPIENNKKLEQGEHNIQVSHEFLEQTAKQSKQKENTHCGCTAKGKTSAMQTFYRMRKELT